MIFDADEEVDDNIDLWIIRNDGIVGAGQPADIVNIHRQLSLDFDDEFVEDKTLSCARVQHCVDYINRILDCECDSGPLENEGPVKILPFVDAKQFYGEYKVFCTAVLRSSDIRCFGSPTTFSRALEEVKRKKYTVHFTVVRLTV
jgi:hypothetical protein